jgi:hypothetical protein
MSRLQIMWSVLKAVSKGTKSEVQVVTADATIHLSCLTTPRKSWPQSHGCLVYCPEKHSKIHIQLCPSV